MTCAFEVTERRMQVRGLTLKVAEAGAGPLVVLVHGVPRLLAAVAPADGDTRSGRTRVIVPHLRGFGDSDKAAAVDQCALPLRAENPSTALNSAVCHPAA